MRTRRTTFDAGTADALRRAAGRESAAFKAGWAAAEAAAARVVADNSVEALRRQGGWTAVLTHAFTTLVGDATVPGLMGEPMPVRALFTPADVATLRNEAVHKADLREA